MPAMYVLNPERPWASVATALQFKWVMTEQGLRMQWTQAETPQPRTRAVANEAKQDQAA